MAEAFYFDEQRCPRLYHEEWLPDFRNITEEQSQKLRKLGVLTPELLYRMKK